MIKLPTGPAICYSGYREGQSPVDKQYPSHGEIAEDLTILRDRWSLLRLYDCSAHAQRVLEIIRRDRLPFRVLLGAHLAAEVNNPACPWGGMYADRQLEANRVENDAETQRLISLARRYPDIVFAVSVGNEALVDWTDHLLPMERMIALVRRVKAHLPQPVTFCENYIPWRHQLLDLAAELDFISLHTYPVWEYKSAHEAIDYTRENYHSVASLYRTKPVIITEAGWTTRSNGRGIEPHNASQAFQTIYLEKLLAWTRNENVLTFIFEAFDEPWKGSNDPLEPEKHWGLYTVDRQPKAFITEWESSNTVASLLPPESQPIAPSATLA
jgi:exo-beta-1,3-glucanase (GH17 family)